MKVPDLALILPGGILPSDVLFPKRHDGTCSRCRTEIPVSDEGPLWLWHKSGAAWVFCSSCLWDDVK